MFVQLIFGNVSDPERLDRQMDAWMRDLAPGATGWLGATSGQSTQGPYCTLVRFESEAAARANSDRPEQGEWWSETEAAYDGPVTFIDSTDIVEFGGGGSDSAGFVQMMRAKVSDQARLEALEDRVESDLQAWRPDLLGGIRVWEPDGQMTAIDYFTSEAEARDNEAKEPSGALADAIEEWHSLLSDVTWYDLSNPRLDSP